MGDGLVLRQWMMQESNINMHMHSFRLFCLFLICMSVCQIEKEDVEKIGVEKKGIVINRLQIRTNKKGGLY